MSDSKNLLSGNVKYLEYFKSTKLSRESWHFCLWSLTVLFHHHSSPLVIFLTFPIQSHQRVEREHHSLNILQCQ